MQAMCTPSASLGKRSPRTVKLGPTPNHLRSFQNGGSQAPQIVLRQHFKLASFSPHFNLLPYGVLGFSSIQVSLFEGYTNQPTWTHPGKAAQILQLCLRGKMHICVDEGVVLGRCLERTSASSCDPVFPDINSIPGPCLLWPVRTTCAQLDVSLGSWT